MPGKKLLVADDSLTIQKVIRLALSNEGYEIQAVSDGNDAVQQISLNRTDVVLIDVSLPGKTAFEVKQEINAIEDLNETRFILMSSAFEKVDEALANEVNFHGRLTKPFDPAHLRQVLVEVLSQVTAKRLEKTTLIQRPDSNPPTSLPTFEMNAGKIKSEPTLSAYHSPKSISPSDKHDKLPIERTGLFSFEPSEYEELPLDRPPKTEYKSEFDLWEPDELSTQPVQTPQLPPPPPTSVPDSFEIESDIHELTETTLKIDPNDDYQWNVQEPRLKPLGRMLDRGPSTFEIPDFGKATPEKLSVDFPPSPPPRLPNTELNYDTSFDDSAQFDLQTHFESSSHFPPPIPSDDDGDSHFMPPPPLPTESAARTPPPPPEDYSSPPLAPDRELYLAPPPAPTPALSVTAITQEQVEKIIHEQVQATLQSVIHQMLPDIAERLIKEEIHRMLSEQAKK